MFKKWLFNEMRHFLLEENPITLRINGTKRRVTGIDFKWEDFGQQKLVMRHFVQEFPHGVGEPGQVFVNAGYWDGYWIEQLTPSDLQKMRTQPKVFGDISNKRLIVDANPALGPIKPPVHLEVNPLNSFTQIDPKSLKEPDESPASFRHPYDRKTKLNWWDFAEVLDGHDVLKHPARIR